MNKWLFWPTPAAAVGAIPTFHAAALDQTSPYTPAYPASIAANDWLLAFAMSVNGTDVSPTTFDTLTGYSDIGAANYDAETTTVKRETRHWARAKVAAGDETGNLTFTLSHEAIAGIARFSGVNNASPIESLQFASNTDTPTTIPTITSLGPNRLAVFILAYGEDGTPSATLANGSGPAPVRQATLATSSGNDRTLAIYTVEMPTAGSISGYQQVVTLTGAEGGFLGFFLKPVGS